jgi:hypothetical protein
MTMSNLSQYRMSLGIFSLGLLWVVSEVVGDGEKPAPLDTATKSVVHRLASSGDDGGDPANAPYQLAVSQAEDGELGANPREAAAQPPARPASPFALDAPTTEGDPVLASEVGAESEPDRQAPPDVGLIHN